MTLMRVRSMLVLLLVALLAVHVAAQVPQRSIAWDYTVPPAVAQAYTHTVTLDGTLLTGAVTCVATATGSSCSLPLPGAVDVQVPHTVAVTAVGGGVQQTTSITTDPAKVPRPASGLRITVTVVVEVP